MAQWGTQQELAVAASYGCVSGADVTLTAGAATTFITTGALTAPTSGPYYPMIWLSATIVFGASAPTALVITFILGAGSAVDTYTVEPGLLTNSGEIIVAIPLVGANSKSAWGGSGSTINIQANATAHAATAKNVGSRAIVALFRGLDL